MPTGFYARKPAHVRFIEKIKQSAGCWTWIGAIGTHGYGRFGFKGKTVQAHRFSYEMFFNKIYFNDLDVCHKCDNRSCVNPNHLFLGTRKDNMQDCNTKGRTTSGEKSSLSKLRSVDVLKIRGLWETGESRANIAKIFSVTESNIYSITKRKSWRNI